MLLVPLLVGIEHAVQPGKELLGAVVGVEHDWNAIGGCDGLDVVSCGDGASNGGRLILVVDALATEVRRTALGKLEDDWGARGPISKMRLLACSCNGLGASE